MDKPPSVAFTADVLPRATETEIGAVLCAIGAGRTLTFDFGLSSFQRCTWNFFAFR